MGLSCGGSFASGLGGESSDMNDSAGSSERESSSDTALGSGFWYSGSGCSVATAAFRASSERAIRVQRYPFFAKSCAMERPMPREPPVMRAWRGRAAMVTVSVKVLCTEIVSVKLCRWKIRIECTFVVYEV